MQKLKLDIENLSVESFDVLPLERSRRGTIIGNETEEGYAGVEEEELAGELEGESHKQPSQRFRCTFSYIWVMCTTI